MTHLQSTSLIALLAACLLVSLPVVPASAQDSDTPPVSADGGASSDTDTDVVDLLRRMESLESELADLRGDGGGGNDGDMTDTVIELEVLIEALMEQVEALEERVPSEQSQIDVSGFAEYAFRVINSNPTSGFFGHWETAGWGQTDLRLLLGANPAPWLRFFAEARFFYTSPTVSNILTDRSVDFRYTFERVQAEIKPFDYLSFRIGYFRTPFGLYGEDNGSPAYITAEIPLSYSFELFPQQQTGVDVYGRVRVSPELEIQYDALVTNGLGSFPQIFSRANGGVGPLSTQYGDPDQEPSWGGDLALNFENIGPFSEIYAKIGYFNGWETDREFIQGNTQDWSRRRHHNTFVVAGRFRFGGVHVQVEWTRAFTPQYIRNLHPTNRNADGSRVDLGGSTELRSWQQTYYIQAGYTIEDAQLTFYGMWETIGGRNQFDPTGQFLRYDADVFSWGLTWRPESWLIVKYQTQLARFDQTHTVHDIDAHILSMTVFFK